MIEHTNKLRSIIDSHVEIQPWYPWLSHDIAKLVSEALDAQTRTTLDMFECHDQASTLLMKGGVYGVLGSADLVQIAVGLTLLQSVGSRREDASLVTEDYLRRAIIAVENRGLLAGMELADSTYGRIWV